MMTGHNTVNSTVLPPGSVSSTGPGSIGTTEFSYAATRMTQSFTSHMTLMTIITTIHAHTMQIIAS